MAIDGARPNAESVQVPPPRAGHGMAYDVESGRLILFSGGLSAGYSDDTWAFDFVANAWSDMSPTAPPPAREAFGVAYDSESDRIVIFGGWRGVGNEFSDTWAYDYNANTWTNMNPPAAPSPRWGGCMAYDAGSDRIIYVGGHFQTATTPVTRYRETWAYHYNTNTWTNMTTQASPSKSNWCGLAYDSGSDEVVLFGGEGGGLSDETWRYDYDSNTWADLSPDPRPPGRWFHAMAYDSRSDRIVLFGGEKATGVRDDQTWMFQLNTNTWTSVNPGVRPSARSYHAMAYDSQSDRILLFGGDRPGLSNETWAFDANAITWTLLATPGPAPDTLAPAVAIDTPADGSTLNATSVVVMGTASDNVALSKVELSADGTTWILATGTTTWFGTLTLRAGSNTIYARATDTSGHVATADVTVNVQTATPPPPPDIAIVALVAAAVAGAGILGAVLVTRRRKK